VPLLHLLHHPHCVPVNSRCLLAFSLHKLALAVAWLIHQW
jgi:hypothetical protein